MPAQHRILFAVGDYVAGGLTGAATAAAVRGVVSPDLDMVLAMLIGTAVGMAVHLAIGVALSPLLGLFHCMVPGGLIGMYGGMLFAMRDVMQPHRGGLGRAIMVGIVFGAAVTAGVRLYDRALRATSAGNERSA
jgi:hypothetical protein